MRQDGCGGKRGFGDACTERFSLSGKDPEVLLHDYLY